VVAIQRNGDRASIPRSRSKPPGAARRVDLTEDGGSNDDEPVVGGLQDEDESLEHAAALASPIKGSDSRKISKVNSMRVSESLSFLLIQTSLT